MRRKANAAMNMDLAGLLLQVCYWNGNFATNRSAGANQIRNGASY